MALRGPPDDRDVAALREFGVVNLDKPPGPSAHQVAAWVRELLGVDRVAHAGTLDPKVTGCLPILTGTAARAARVFDDAVKEYVAVLELHGPAPANFQAVLAEFEGEIFQKPPKHSAVARRLRTREIYRLDVLEREDRRALVRIRCESGTYVRKLCHDLGLALGIGAHMGDLRRVGTGSFDDTTLVTLHDLADALAWAEDGDETVLREIVQPAERALADLPGVTIAESAAREVANGAPLYAPGVIDAPSVEVGSSVACYTPNGAVVSLGEFVGDAAADEGTVVETERVLV